MAINSMDELRRQMAAHGITGSDESLLKRYADDMRTPIDHIANAVGYNNPNGSLTGERLDASWSGYKANLQDTGRAVARGLGLGGVADTLDSWRADNDTRKDIAGARASDLGGIDRFFDDPTGRQRSVHGLGDFFGNYLPGLAIQSLPYVGEMAAGGYAARAASLGARTALNVGRELGMPQTVEAASNALRTRSTVGGVAASYPSAMGDILSNQREANPNAPTNDGMAALGAIPYAALNIFEPSHMAATAGLRSFRTPMGVLDRFTGVPGGLARAGGAFVAGGLKEGVAETGQEGINQYFGRMATNPNATMTDPDAIDRYKESFAGGLFLGGGTESTLGGWRRTDGWYEQQRQQQEAAAKARADADANRQHDLLQPRLDNAAPPGQQGALFPDYNEGTISWLPGHGPQPETIDALQQHSALEAQRRGYEQQFQYLDAQLAAMPPPPVVGPGMPVNDPYAAQRTALQQQYYALAQGHQALMTQWAQLEPMAAHAAAAGVNPGQMTLGADTPLLGDHVGMAPQYGQGDLDAMAAEPPAVQTGPAPATYLDLLGVPAVTGDPTTSPYDPTRLTSPQPAGRAAEFSGFPEEIFTPSVPSVLSVNQYGQVGGPVAQGMPSSPAANAATLNNGQWDTGAEAGRRAAAAIAAGQPNPNLKSAAAPTPTPAPAPAPAPAAATKYTPEAKAKAKTDLGSTLDIAVDLHQALADAPISPEQKAAIANSVANRKKGVTVKAAVEAAHGAIQAAKIANNSAATNRTSETTSGVPAATNNAVNPAEVVDVSVPNVPQPGAGGSSTAASPVAQGGVDVGGRNPAATNPVPAPASGVAPAPAAPGVGTDGAPGGTAVAVAEPKGTVLSRVQGQTAVSHGSVDFGLLKAILEPIDPRLHHAVRLVLGVDRDGHRLDKPFSQTEAATRAKLGDNNRAQLSKVLSLLGLDKGVRNKFIASSADANERADGDIGEEPSGSSDRQEDTTRYLSDEEYDKGDGDATLASQGVHALSSVGGSNSNIDAPKKGVLTDQPWYPADGNLSRLTLNQFADLAVRAAALNTDDNNAALAAVMTEAARRAKADPRGFARAYTAATKLNNQKGGRNDGEVATRPESASQDTTERDAEAGGNDSSPGGEGGSRVAGNGTPAVTTRKRRTISKPAVGEVIEDDEQGNPLVTEPDAELLLEHVDNLTTEEQQELESAYDADVGDESFTSQLAADVQRAAAGKLSQVAESIRKIVAKITKAVLSVAAVMGLTFNPQFSSDAYARVATSMPKTITVNVTTTKTQVKATQAANYNGRALSPNAKAIADWINTNGKSDEVSLILDPATGKMYVMKGGKVVADSPALYGKAGIGQLTPGATATSVDDTKESDKITPAGRHTLSKTTDSEYGTRLDFYTSKQKAWAVHRVYLGSPEERRQARLDSATAADNAVSFGCVNVDPEFYKSELMKYDYTGKAFAYMLPSDPSQLNDFFNTRNSTETVTETTQRKQTTDGAYGAGTDNNSEAYNERRKVDQGKGQTKFSKDKPKGGSTTARVMTEISKLRLGLNPDKVVVVQSIEDLPYHAIQSLSEEGPDGGKVQGFVLDGKAYLVADNIAPGAARGVFMHEVGAHLGMDNLLTGREFLRLVSKLREWANANDGSQESQLARKAMERISNAKTDDTQALSELIAYFVEEATNAGIDPTALQYKSELGRWFQQMISALKSALSKLGLVNAQGLTAQDVVDLAYGAAHVALKVDGRVEGGMQKSMADARSKLMKWFGDSKIVNKDGTPKVMYHGTARDISEFRAKQAGAIFLTDDPKFAEQFAVNSEFWMRSNEAGEPESGQNIMPLYVRAENPFDYENPAHARALVDALSNVGIKSDRKLREHVSDYANNNGMRISDVPMDKIRQLLLYVLENPTGPYVWEMIESDAAQRAIKALGHDSFYVMESGRKNLAVYSPNQIKSAVGNNGEYSRDDNRVQFSKSASAPTVKFRGDRGTVGNGDVIASLRNISEDDDIALDAPDRVGAVMLENITRQHDGQKGRASEVLQAVTDWADANGKTLVLNPAGSGDLKTADLKAWYSRNGFKMAADGAMERAPSTSGRVQFSKAAQPATAAEIRENINQYPGQLRDPLRAIASAFKSFSQSTNALMFSADLYDKAIKLGMATTAKYRDLLAQKAADVSRIEQTVTQTMNGYRDLPAKLQGKGAGTVNDFLYQSTRSRGWGFQPSWVSDPVTINPEMKKLYDAMPPEGRKFVEAALKLGADTLAEKKELVTKYTSTEYDALIANETDPATKAKLEAEKASALKQFGSMMSISGKEPYAPMKRFGQHVVIATSKAYMEAHRNGDTAKMRDLEQNENDYFVNFYETPHHADWVAKQLAQLNEFSHADAVARRNFDEVRDKLYGGSKTLHALTQIKGRLDMLPEGESRKAKQSLHKLVTDMYLLQLANDSSRKQELRRRNIVGDLDMIRSLEVQGRADAQFIGSVKHAGGLLEALNAMRRESHKGGDETETSAAFNEIVKRHVQGQDYKPRPVADAMARTTSLWMLATSPGYYLQNLMQPWTMSAPYMAGAHDLTKVWGALGGTYKDIAQAFKATKLTRNMDIEALLSGATVSTAEKAMLRHLMEQGQLDIGMGVELGEGRAAPEGAVSGAMRNVTRSLREMQMKMEAVNRITTALAAHRLHTASGKTEAEARAYAGEVIQRTHGDYSAGNAPRAFNTGLGKVALQFRKYQLIQLSTLAKLAKQSFGDAPPAEKAIARKALGFMLGQAAILGGGKALPIPFLAAWLFKAIFGDDADEPPEYVLRKMIGNKDVADLLINGVAGKAGISSALLGGYGNAVSLLPFQDMPSDRNGMAGVIAAAVGGPSTGLAMKAMDGLVAMKQGDYYKGVMSIAPKGAASLMKAAREAEHGVAQTDGDVVMRPDEISGLDTFQQALGLTPAKQEDRMYRQKAAYDIEKSVKDQAHNIKAEYTKAMRAEDSAAAADARKEWGDLIAKERKLGLKPSNYGDLMKAPAEQLKRERNTVGYNQFRANDRGFKRELADL